MIVASSSWTPRGRWLDDWRKESGQGASRCTLTTSSPIGRRSRTDLELMPAEADEVGSNSSRRHEDGRLA